MKRSGFFAVVLLVLSALPASATLTHSTPLVAPFIAPFVAYAQPRSYYEARVNLAEPEQARIRRHLATVEAELRTRSVEHLSASQRVHRLARLDDLHAYWTRGEFPRNLDFPDRLIPYFIDAVGAPCAMGYLVIASGYGDFAQEIRRVRNNAYIGEIAAADGRLAEWTEAQGMTLEEAAMVQPGYGPPALSSVSQIQIDGLSRPWAFGSDGNNIGAASAFYFDSSQWKLSASIGFGANFCITSSGLPLMLGSGEAQWKSRTYNFSKAPTACRWISSDADAWLATEAGLVRVRRSGSTDSLIRTVFTTPLGSDTVTGVATATGAVWAGTPRGVYRRGLQGADTAVTAWDSTTLSGRKVTGLKASGTRVWVGMDGLPPLPGSPFVSRKGLRRYTGSAWMTYRQSMSSIQAPNDTINALAMRDTASVWVATPQGFFLFNLTTTQKVADIPADAMVRDMEGNAQGFYAATTLGVYQYRNDSLVFLGKPAVSLLPWVAGKGGVPASRLQMFSGRGSDPTDIRSLLGRKAGRRAGAGVYVTEPVEPR